MKATYTRWDCPCGPSPDQIEVGERPANLPECHAFPHQALRCDCGGILNLVESDPAPARYLDGVPANLPAAAYDALDWIRWLWNRAGEGKIRLPNPQGLAKTIDRLQGALDPHLPAVFEQAKETDLSSEAAA